MERGPEGYRFQYKIMLYILFYIPTLIFARWVRWKKLRSVSELEYYAWFYDKYSEFVMQVRKGAARWPALEAVYNWCPSKKGIWGILENFWMNVRSAQALRNRKQIVVKLIREAVLEKIRTDGEARILSLACGSAQSVFEAIEGIDENVSVLAIDVDETAIEYSKKLAVKYGIKNIEWRKGNLVRPGSTAKDFEPNIVEIVGLFDYLKDSMIVRLIHSIEAMSTRGAVLVSAHIHPNSEMYFLADIADWDMIYRPLPEFKRIIREGGIEEAKFYTEPHGIFSIVRGVIS
ncbi:TPA: hypothetical protein DD449_03235 [Candidatus Berkelbacteria bacterium]|uniref:Methyltransferase domain-containing protein n=1 Tax=Berkelbacteria bacterium GW2011_GWE1_39_12 TaxID=1618337 RepID=A0A0G4B515_9BACT|nr:MAG: hypothetical protein UT28_C0001G0276 [Berkelbacteria bacterium GW2011_GWE1_39_12]HBO60672.1 hypothetical protein [Candidatus Berkelbacteria bacterium]